MVGSAIVAANAAPAGSFDHLFDLQTPAGVAIRFTFEGFTTENIGAGAIYTPAQFDLDGDTVQVNEAAPYPGTNWGGEEGPQTEWTPSPVTIGEEQAGALVRYFGTFQTSDSIPVAETFSLLVEVDVEPVFVLGDPYVIKGTHRAYVGVDSPQAAWVRTESGKLDLSGVTALQAVIKRGASDVLSVDATSPEAGKVSFTITGEQSRHSLSWSNSYTLHVIADGRVIYTGILEVIP